MNKYSISILKDELKEEKHNLKVSNDALLFKHNRKNHLPLKRRALKRIADLQSSIEKLSSK